ncbi:cellulase family glycosylhydrolase [Streptomyces sp. ACA25]|uniref:cellulase family glycosylhydrolase n=1 Tax=Streptomyces sp. ACA25 TaxID=3022596 RepID=UPI0023077623|nr:cellulase family glycosylhydrolase [Streptomyces sp. ACA25]MDB1087583.1 cellulase family glycosylhydrolase [Streptomyces sp. ACA25]
MKKRTRLGLAVGAALATLFGLLVAGPGSAVGQPSTTQTGLHVSDGRLVESNGNDFVMRGVNHPHAWYPQETSSIANIKGLGANSIRVVLSSGHRWERNSAQDVASVIADCRANRVICVLEVHDTTGYGEQDGAATLDQAADYWIGIKSALEGQEDYVIINIGNEPHGNQGYERWAADTRGAIQKLRNAGFDHALMVDGPNWGQDWTNTMRNNAQSVFDADPHGNTVFSIHMYGVYETESSIRSYLSDFVNAGLPILVGEFGHDHSDGTPDEDAILRLSEEFGTGYLGWSWSGNGSPVEYLDMVNNFNPNSLTSWGERLFNGPNGIAETSREAAVFGSGQDEDTTPPSRPGTPAASAVTSSTVSLTWTPSTDNVGVTAYDIVRVSGSDETRVATSAAPSITVGGLDADTEYVFAVYARDAAGNRSDRSGTVSVTTSAGGEPPAADCAVDYRVLNDWGSGFQADVTIRNTGSTAIDDWTLGWTFTDGQTISNMWGGTASQTGSSVTVQAASYTSAIPAGGSVSVGFTGTHTGSNSVPAAFTLNSAACTAR